MGYLAVEVLTAQISSSHRHHLHLLCCLRPVFAEQQLPVMKNGKVVCQKTTLCCDAEPDEFIMMLSDFR